MGIPKTSIILEKKSKNTFENAFYTYQLIGSNGKWGLITSAAHMPRAYNSFKKVGFSSNLIPIPVDYRTSFKSYEFGFGWDKGIRFWRIIFHETLGTIVYKFMGKI